MDVRIVLFVVGLASSLRSTACSRIFPANDVWERDFVVTRSDDKNSEPEFYDTSAGPEKLSIEILHVDKNGLEVEEGGNEALGPEVDEDTIRKAEKMADKDLLKGLNRILKNNETLKDVFKAEHVYQIS